MLRELRITNFAIIDQVALELKPGLNILTGETGAGKSIVLNALGLIAGERGTTDIIRSGADEATVEGLFDVVPASAANVLRDAGFEIEDELVIKRVLSRSGRNRIYLNGSLCPLGVLAQAGAALVHIYGQHEHHTLLQAETHLSLLDVYAGVNPDPGMKEAYAKLVDAANKLGELRESLAQRRREKALLEAQVEEIARAKLRPGEEEEIRSARTVLAHGEKLRQGCREGEDLLYAGDRAVVSAVTKYAGRLRELAALDNALKPALELLESSVAQLQEAAIGLRRYADRVHADPRALEQAEDRLAEIQRLKRKYNTDIDGILRLHQELRESLMGLEQGEEQIAGLEKSLAAARAQAWDQAEKVSAERRRAAKKLSREMEREVKSLGMPDTTFEVRFASDGDKSDEPPFLIGGKRLTERGIDHAEFYFSPNPGEPVKPLAKIASGGELSRLMLALKALVIAPGVVSTLLFDEVDSGIGGRVAEIVGKKLKQVAAHHQVLSVTHLPQIAALADAHFAVQKTVEKGRTFTRVVGLGARERVAELARMLGGIKITEQTRKHAEEMLRGR
jgi:DNA repair protein RecN (Recombination protein N)